MLTLEDAELLADRLSLDAQPDRVAPHAMDLNTPMACDEHVADAACHLISAFLIVEDLGGAPPSRTVNRSATSVQVISQNICTALEELNKCSLGFWFLPHARMAPSARLRGFCRRFNFRGDAPADRSADMKPQERVAAEFVTQGLADWPGSSSRPPDQGTTRVTNGACFIESERDELVSAAVLHLLGAYRAMEALSASAFLSVAPRSFALACHCLCTALVVLDTCLAGCVD
jgi:hypothetical protein